MNEIKYQIVNNKTRKIIKHNGKLMKFRSKSSMNQFIIEINNDYTYPEIDWENI